MGAREVRAPVGQMNLERERGQVSDGKEVQEVSRSFKKLQFGRNFGSERRFRRLVIDHKIRDVEGIWRKR